MTTEVRVRGMTCQGCEEVVETAIDLINGVESVTADRYEDRVEVSGNVSVNEVIDKIELAGYRALGPVTDEDDEEVEPTDEPVVDELEE